MATYTQRPDYQTYVSSPYNLPVQQIVQAIDTRNRYWDSSASQIKNAYQQYLNLNLTHQSNKDNLNGLMKGVNEGLKKVTQSDLSIASNLGEAMQIFDPITNGKTEVSRNILGDSAITKHYESQMQLAESFRLKDNGKEYSPTNISYMMQGLDRFSKDKPGNWKEHYSTRRSYTPFYDVQAEVRDLMKNFKPNITSSTVPDIDPKTGQPKSFYLISKTDKSAYEKQLKAYLGANLSDRAKTQLSINGAVSYYDNPSVLANDYSEYNRARMTGLKQDIEALQGVVKGSTNQQLIDAANTQISSLQNALDDATDEDTKLKAGDSDFFKRNIDRIAGSIYSDKYIKNLAKANERIDVDISYKPDQAALRWFSEEQENKRFNRRLEFDAFENQADRDLRLRIAQMTKEGNNPTPGFLPSTQTADESNNQRVNIDFVNEQRALAEDLKKQASDRLSQEIQSLTGQDLSKLSKIEREKMVEQWASENKGRNPVVDDYYSKFNTANNIEKVYNDLDNFATEEVKKRHPNLFTPEGYKPLQIEVKTTAGESINLNLPSDKMPEFIAGIRETPVKGSDGSVVGYRQTINYNGRTYQLQQPSFSRLQGLVQTGQPSKASDIQSYKNEILNKSITAIREEKIPVGDQEKIKEFNNLRNDFRRFGVKDAAVKDIRIFSVERNGVNFVVPPALGTDELGVSPGQLEANITAMGGRKKTVDGSPVYFVPYSRLTWSPSTYNDPELNPIRDYFNYRRQIEVDKGNMNTTIDAPQTVVYDPNHTGENIKLKMDINSGVPEYFIVYDKKKIYDLSTGRGFSSIEHAAAYIKQYIRTKDDLKERIKNF